MGYNRNKETQRRLKNKYIRRYQVPIYFDEEKGIWRRFYWSRKGKNSYTKYLRKRSNRVSRRSKEIYQGKGLYRKEFDYWWELL